MRAGETRKDYTPRTQGRAAGASVCEEGGEVRLVKKKKDDRWKVKQSSYCEVSEEKTRIDNENKIDLEGINEGGRRGGAEQKAIARS